MSTETLLLAGKPGTGKLAPGKVTPLKGVKAKPELTQQLVVKQAPPPTPDIPHWKGDFPFPKDIVYTDKPDGKLIADLRMTVEKSGIERPSRGKWGAVRAQWGKADVPLLDKVVVVETEEGYKITNAIFLLKIEFGIINYNSPAWESAWDSGMEKLTGRYGITPEERKYWAFQHEMDHFRAWSEYFRFVLKHVFSALNTGFESEKSAKTRVKELNYNIVENFIVAAQRSHAFDEYRGAPLSGNKYSAFDFPDCECYRWHQSGDLLPQASDKVGQALIRIKQIDDKMFQ